MDEFFRTLVTCVEVAAAGLLAAGLIISSALYVRGILLRKGKEAYTTYRRNLGRTLLLTLEFLIAADILETVAVETTLASLGTLGLLVVIRTFLSFTLELEVAGRWPWQKEPQSDPPIQK